MLGVQWTHAPLPSRKKGLIPLSLGSTNLKNFRVTKIFKETKFEVVWDQLESKKRFHRRSVTKYIRLSLVFI